MAQAFLKREKLQQKRAQGFIFGPARNITSASSEPTTTMSASSSNYSGIAFFVDTAIATLILWFLDQLLRPGLASGNLDKLLLYGAESFLFLLLTSWF